MPRLRPTLLASFVAAGTLVAASFPVGPAFADASNDHTAPTILKVEADRATALPGETVQYRIEFSDEHPRTSDMRATRGNITNLLQYPYYWDAANPGSSPRDELEPDVSREQVEKSVRAIGVDAAGHAAFEVTVDVKVPERAWYGNYHWNAGSLYLYDENANGAEVVLPDFTVDDPQHPVDNVATTSLTEGAWRAKYVLPGHRDYGATSSVFFGDTITADLDAPGATLSYVWKGGGSAPARSKSMSPAIDAPSSNNPVSVEVTATWPDGVKRVREAQHGYTKSLIIPAELRNPVPETTGAIGTYVIPSLRLNPDAESMAPGITRGLKTTWWRLCGGGICQVVGPQLFLLPGDEAGYGVTFSMTDEQSSAHPMVSLGNLPWSDQVVVTPGTVPTPTPVISNATVLGQARVDLSGFKGAESFDLEWEVPNWASRHTSTSSKVGTFTPGREWGGSKLRVHVTATYATGRRSTPVTSAWVTVANAKQTVRVPVVTGTPAVGSTLKASVSTSGLASGSRLAWQWYRGTTAIKNATGSTYKLTAADLKAKVWVKAAVTADGYSRASSNSASVTVKAGTLVKGKVVAKGTAKAKRQLSASLSSWKSGNAYSFQWTKNGKAIKGATAPRYTTKLSDRGAKIAVKVTAKRAGFTTVTVTSAARTIARR